MLKSLIGKEILNNLLNYRFILAYFVCTVLLVSSAAILYSDYLSRKHDSEVNTNIFRNRLSGEMEDWAYFANIWVSRPVGVLSVFAMGNERDPDNIAQVTKATSPDFRTELRKNPLRAFFPKLDTLFIVGVIVCLLVFLLTFDTVSGEREEGTLKLLLSGPLPRDAVYLAKWIGGFICLLLPFVTSMALIGLILTFGGTVSLSGAEWMRLAGILLLCILYIGVVFSFSMMISTLVRQSSVTILLLLGTWALFIVAIPALAGPIAQLAVDPPSVEAAETANHFIPDTLLKADDPKIRQCTEQARTASGVKPGPSMTQEQEREWYRMSIRCNEKEGGSNVVDTIISVGRRRDRSLNTVERASEWISRISPYGCLQHACIALAGTGRAHELALRSALYAYARAHMDYRLAQLEKKDVAPWMISADAAPRFNGKSAVVPPDLLGILLDTGLLALMAVLFFMIGFSAFLRSEVA